MFNNTAHHKSIGHSDCWSKGNTAHGCREERVAYIHNGSFGSMYVDSMRHENSARCRVSRSRDAIGV